MITAQVLGAVELGSLLHRMCERIGMWSQVFEMSPRERQLYDRMRRKFDRRFRDLGPARQYLIFLKARREAGIGEDEECSFYFVPRQGKIVARPHTLQGGWSFLRSHFSLPEGPPIEGEEFRAEGVVDVVGAIVSEESDASL